jgi:hypothetical protein
VNKYLKIPSYYEDLTKNIYSENLQVALKQEDILIYLRQTYRTDISLFYHIRDELMLRGIVFKKEFQNNFFPDLPYEIQHIIDIEEDKKSFQSINTDITGLQTIINRYNINSDLFFINMPIEGIAHFLKKDVYSKAV